MKARFNVQPEVHCSHRKMQRSWKRVVAILELPRSKALDKPPGPGGFLREDVCLRCSYIRILFTVIEAEKEDLMRVIWELNLMAEHSPFDINIINIFISQANQVCIIRQSIAKAASHFLI